MAKEAAEAVKEPKPTVTSIFVDVYPELSGAATKTTKRSPAMNDLGDKFGYDFRIPVPTTDKEAKEYYNLSLAQLIEKGVVQHAYSESAITKMLVERRDSGKPMDSANFIDKLAEAMKTLLIWTPRESKASEAKIAKDTVAELYRDYGLDPNKDDQPALMKAIRESRKAK